LPSREMGQRGPTKLAASLQANVVCFIHHER
jgi:hypothetical protein